MIVLLLIAISAAAAIGTSQTSLAGAGAENPPDIEILGSDIGPGFQMSLRPEYETGQGLIRQSRVTSGDLERDTSRYAANGRPRNWSMEASMGLDPFVDYSPDYLPPGYVIRPKKAVLATLVIRNNGVKTVKTIDWEFQYPHITNNKTALRYLLKSHAVIRPGEIKTIREPLPHSARAFNIMRGNGPQRTVTFISSADGLSLTVPVDCLRESARINRILYADGTIWQRPAQ